MDCKSIIVVMMFVVTTQANCTAESQNLLVVTGTHSQFYFSSRNISVRTRDLSFWYGNTRIVYHILYITNLTGHYHRDPLYENRVVMYGYKKKSSYRDWNMTITLLNVSEGDEGEYQLMGRRDPIENGSICLYILDFPEVYLSDFSNSKKVIFTVEGGNLVVSGKPATILPNNSHYDVNMMWLLNDQVLLPAGPFTVREDRLSIWPVPANFHSANLTYLATVVGHDVTTSVTTQIFVVSIDVRIHPRQTLYDVKEGYFIPDVVCEFIFNQPTRITWAHRDKVVSNGSVLSLGRIERTMSGEYTCSVIVASTGMRKEKSIYLIVDEVNEKPSAVSTIILSTITGLVVAALIAMGILLFRNSRQKQGTKIHQQENENEGRFEMNEYTVLQRRSHDQQLYDVADRSIVMEPEAALPVEPRVYENQLVTKV